MKREIPWRQFRHPDLVFPGTLILENGLHAFRTYRGARLALLGVHR